MHSIRLHIAFRRTDEIDVAMLALLLPLTSALVRISHAPLLSSLSKVCASAHETHAATFVAFNGARMGSCTLEAVALSEEDVQMRSGATLRPLLKALIVQSQARHQGVGTLRVDNAAALAAKWGYKELFCYVNLTNEAARALYRRCGFAPERDAPAENFVRWLSGDQMLFFPRDLQAGQPHQSAATRPRRRLGLATMRLPVAVSEALPWDESAYAAVEVEALWEAVLKAYGSEDAAAKAVRQVRAARAV
jgi:GNAT superfamily N-acetyltransferase